MSTVEDVILDACPTTMRELFQNSVVPEKALITAKKALLRKGLVKKEGHFLVKVVLHDYLILNPLGHEVALYRAESGQQALSFYPAGYRAIPVTELPEKFCSCPFCYSDNTRRFGYRPNGQPKMRCDGCGKTYGVNGFKAGMKKFKE